MDKKLAEIRKIHEARARKQEEEEKKNGGSEEKTVKPKGKVIGGKYFENPPNQFTLKEYNAIVDKYQRIKRQAKALVTKIEIDDDAARMFQSYLVRTNFARLRYGVMYGTVDKENVVRCHAVYEPEQTGDATHFERLPDKRLDKIDGLAALLGWQRVGLLVSSPPINPSDPVITGQEAILCAEEQAKYGPHCCIIQMRPKMEGERDMVTEAYQVSQQMVDIYREGTLSPGSQRQNVHSARELEAVLEQKTGGKTVVARETTFDVDTTWFAVPVPIGSFQSNIGSRFIRIYRPGEAPPTWENVKNFLLDPKRRSKPFCEQVADFHLLVFLTEAYDMKTDMPTIVRAVCDGDNAAVKNYEMMVRARSGLSS